MTKIITTLEALKAVMPFVSKEETRYYLNGVYFDHGMLVATDGHKLGCIKPAFYQGAEADGFILPSETANKLIKAAPPARKARGMSMVYVVFDTVKKIASVATDLDSEISLVSFSFEPIDGTFPDYRRVIPDASNFVCGEVKDAKTGETTTVGQAMPAAFNPEYLGMFKSFGINVTFFPHKDNRSPMIVRGKTDYFDALGVCIPMRAIIEIDNIIPDWFKTAPVAENKTEAPRVNVEALKVGDYVARKADTDDIYEVVEVFGKRIIVSNTHGVEILVSPHDLTENYIPSLSRIAVAK